MVVSDRQFDAVEARLSAVERNAAVLNNVVENTNTSLRNIESVLARITWLIVTAVIVALLGTVIGSGVLHVPGL